MNRLMVIAATALLALTLSACGDKDAKPAGEETTAVAAPAEEHGGAASEEAKPAEEAPAQAGEHSEGH